MTDPSPETNGKTLHVAEIAKRYMRNGWAPIPIPDRQKNPGFKGWQNCILDERHVARFCGGQKNVGVLLGEPSGGLCDVDLDHPKAVELAPKYLPSTPAIFGRASKPKSHYLYKLIGPSKTLKQQRPGKDLPDHEKMIVELRWTGCQTVFPGSIHPSGERIEWLDSAAQPAEVPATVIEAAVKALGKAVLVELGEAPEKKSSRRATPTSFEPIPERDLALMALAALSVGRVDSYDDWLKVGQALHSLDSSAAMLAEWDRWSSTSGKYQAGECESKWAGFDAGGGVGIGTLFHFAIEDGWVRPGPAPRPFASGTTEKIIFPIRNGVQIETDDGTIIEPFPMPKIIAEINERTNGWPRRIGPALFVDDKGAISWLQSSSSVFGYIGTATNIPPEFLRSPACHSRDDVFAELRRTATAYRAVETLPHEPPIPEHYYACKIPEPGDGIALETLVSKFCPKTPVDSELIRALFASLLWGGGGGTRPAWLVTSDDGRGAGKSKLVAMAGHLAGGVIDLSANEDAAVIKQRLLSPDGQTKRIALLDNVKTMRFSWAELEALITAPTISGKAMYIGEMSRPNNLLWIITLNGASLSTDMAQRCVIIHITRPTYDPTWEESTREFITQNRQQIIADLIAFLRSERKTLARHSRWGSWERDILARLPDPAAAQALIAERQSVADVESEESDLIEDFFRQQLARLGYSVDTEQIFIPSAIAARWFNWATGEKHTTSGVSRMLKQKIDEGKFHFLSVCPNRVHGRGFHWTGKDAVHSEDKTLHDIETKLREFVKEQHPDTKDG
ncbi:MAG: PriCT-2 domain-containing protein [Planctomycetaceae bacterium]|nr:PriCT-2 domain-containing protein [Planctomycetaceae bacterium]